MLKQEQARMPRIFRMFGLVKSFARQAGRGEEGETVVETAIATSIVLMLLFAVFDFSLLFYTYHYISDAAREGSRYAMVRGSTACSHESNLDVCNGVSSAPGATTSDISSYVAGLPYPGINPSNMTVSTTWLCAGGINGTTGETWNACGTGAGVTDNAPGNQVQVQVTYDFPLSVPFWKQTTLTVSSTSSMVISQ